MNASERQPQHSGTARSRYRLYIDESGDHVFHNERALAEPAHRFLALCGCFFEMCEYVMFHDQWELMKRRHFPHSPDEPVILHRSDIINRRGPFWRLREPDADRALRDDLLSVIQAGQFKIVVVVIDKLALTRNYSAPFHPYHAALGFMLQRYSGYLNHLNRRGDVMAESRGKTEDNLLKNAYSHIHTHGDMHHRSEFYKRSLTSKELKLKKKPANIAGLQLADLLAHPLRRAILAEAGHVAGEDATFGSRLAAVAEAKYNRHLYDGRVEGYGWVLFPR